MDETYRMLGREHQADLDREARKRQLAAEARGGRRSPAAARAIALPQRRVQLIVARFAAFLGRAARAEA